MADVKKLVSLENLTSYDTLIKKYIGDADAVVDAKSIKTVLVDGDNIKFYKKANATTSDTPDYTVAIASSDVTQLKTDVANLKDVTDGYTTKGSISTAVADAKKAGTDAAAAVTTLENGQVKTNKEAIEAINNSTTGILATAKGYTDTEVGKVNTTIGTVTEGETVVSMIADAKKAGTDAATAVTTLDTSLKAIAKSGKAADVSVEDASEKLTATTVEGALLEIVNKADANATAITTLNGDDATAGSVAKKIKDAIEDLDGTVTGTGNFVKTISETDGKITATLGGIAVDDVPTLTLSKISDAGTAAAATVATTAIGSTGEVKTALPTVGQVETYIATEIAGLEGAMHFVGVITREEGETDEEAISRVITAPKSGDVVVMADNAKEYVFVDPDPETAGDESWRLVGDEGSYVKKTTTIAGVDLEDNITKAELLTALNVADGAQVNVIEGVQVNGTDLVNADKKVNVTVATGSANGTVAVNGVDVAVKGLDTAAYAKTTDFEAAGTVATEIAKLDATVSTVTEENPTPVVAVTVTEVDGKLTAVSASIKDQTFEAYGTTATEIGKLDATVSQVASETNPVAISVVEEDGKLTSVSASVSIATTTDINALFADKTEE